MPSPQPHLASTQEFSPGIGGGGIGGTIAGLQVAFGGNAPDTIAGSPNFTYDSATGQFLLQDITSQRIFLLSPSTGTFSLGYSLPGQGNGTHILIDDQNGAIRLLSDFNVYVGRPSGGNATMSIQTTLHQVYLGDLDNTGNSNLFVVDDVAGQIRATASNQFLVTDINGDSWFAASPQNKQVILGDILGSFNSTKIDLQDTAQTIDMIADNIAMLSLNQVAGLYRIGDVTGAVNNTRISINDTLTQIVAVADDYFQVENSANQRFLFVEPLNARVFLGDIDGSGNATQFVVDDGSQRAYVTNGVFALFGYTVATLPVAASAGDMAYVTDALGPSWGVAVAGGGVAVVPVFFNGTIWICG